MLILVNCYILLYYSQFKITIWLNAFFVVAKFIWWLLLTI